MGTAQQDPSGPIELPGTPRLPLPVEELDRHLQVDPPALIKGYLRCGAKILGAPAWDPDFNTADLPMLMRIQDLPPAIAAISLAPDANRSVESAAQGLTARHDCLSRKSSHPPLLPNHCRFGSC